MWKSVASLWKRFILRPALSQTGSFQRERENLDYSETRLSVSMSLNARTGQFKSIEALKMKEKDEQKVIK